MKELNEKKVSKQTRYRNRLKEAGYKQVVLFLNDREEIEIRKKLDELRKAEDKNGNGI